MRYFFDIDEQPDEVGTELPDDSAVAREALSLILAVAADALERKTSVRVAVRDELRRPVYCASLQLEGRWTDMNRSHPD